MECIKSIQRTFYDISREYAVDAERVERLAHLRLSGTTNWETLLQSRRVLIISEAGAGKTYECRARQQELWHRGEPAFYLDLAELARDSLKDLLTLDEETRLEAWLAAQADVATFFLDSIDELKLTQGSFEMALKRLNKVIASQLGRARIVITTRPVAVDLELIERHLSIPAPAKLAPSGNDFADIATGRQRPDAVPDQDAPPDWRNVALMPLSDDQISDFAATQGITDSEELLADLRTRGADDFARRPQDLIELCADWRDYRRIRTHREQVENNVRIKLQPRSNGHELAQLAPDKAFEGASRLALAALLTRKLTIRHSVEADKGGKPGTSLDPAIILPDWTPQERATLLERGLFGFASYGRVRFHHRSVIEFLAARRLENRLANGMPIKAVKRLVFADTEPQLKLVKPTMRPVAAWLASSHPSIFNEVRDREPDALLNYGDPETLSLSQRVDALRSYVRRFGTGGWRGLEVPSLQLHRFVSTDMADHVLSLWHEGIENPEVRELFLDLIGAGPMPLCSVIAHDAAMNQGASNGERLAAISAMTSLQDPHLKTVSLSMEENPAIWPNSLLLSALLRLFPAHISSDRFCRILTGVRDSESATSPLAWVLPRRIAEAQFPLGYLETLRDGLTTLVCQSLDWKEKSWPQIETQRPDLLPALAAVCIRHLRCGAAEDSIFHSAVVALRLLSRNHNGSELAKELRAVLEELPSPSREKVFWGDDKFCQRVRIEENPWRRLHRISFDGPLKLDPAKDAAWVSRVLADKNRPTAERAMMLHAAMRGIWDGAQPFTQQVQGIRSHVADSPELEGMIDPYLAPKAVDPDMAELQARIEQERKAAEVQDAENHETWVEFWRQVAEHPNTAFSPDKSGQTAWDLWQAMQRTGAESRTSGWNRRFIEQYFGKDVADRLRATMREIWRKDKPTLRYEREPEERGTILIRWQLGLAAIAAEAEDSDWARKLSVEEAELATRYAPIELVALPGWLTALAHEHPAAVERTLGPDLTAELEEIVTHGAEGTLLQGLRDAPAEITHLFHPRLLAWLDGHSEQVREGENVASVCRRIGIVLEILFTHGDSATRAQMQAKAEQQIQSSTDKKFMPIWLAALTLLAPAIGVDTLQRVLEPIEPSAASDAVSIFGAIFSQRRVNLLVDPLAAGFTPSLLLRLVRLAYQHVRLCDDVRHAGVYAPGDRDNAQDARNAVLKALLGTTGVDAWQAKLEMAADPLFVHLRDRIITLARDKAAEEADGTTLREPEVAILDHYGEAPPATRDDMFSLLVDRLDDLDDLLLQDVSPRAAWAIIKDEKVMRQQIALQLRNGSNSIYTVDQEAVTADEKETDIRLRVATSGQQATIELKIGENWSGRQLRDTIKDQLVTKYMAAEQCRSGCLVVTATGDSGWKHPETSESLDIDGLRAMLCSEAAKIVEEMAGELRLAVKVIDLRPRLSANSKAVQQ